MKTKRENGRESFVLYRSFYGPISGLSDEQLGRVFRAIFRWQSDGMTDQDPDPAVNVAIAFITNQFRIDADKYRERCERNQANGRLGGRPKKTVRLLQKPNGFFENPNENENENENENGNENVKGGPGDKSPARKQSFVKPSFDDVAAYCTERANGIDPGAFMDYYEANGWKIGKNKMKDWRAAIRTWERNHDKGQKTPTPGPATGPIITNIDDVFKD